MRETKWWTWHLAAGAVILVLLALHMVVMHLDDLLRILNPAGGKAIAWGNVLARSQMMFFVITYVILLGAALYHGFYGLRTILFELNLGQSLQRLITLALWVGGIGLFAIGTWAAITVRFLEKTTT